MWVTAIQIDNVRGYKKLLKTEFSKGINILIGPNNSGKSTILNAIYKLQGGGGLNESDKTIGALNGIVAIYVNGTHPHSYFRNRPNSSNSNYLFRYSLPSEDLEIIRKHDSIHLSYFSNKEPDNLIYPYLSKRKTVQYIDNINEENAFSVAGNFKHLFSKIDRLVTPQFQPGNTEYVNACRDILGFEISTIAKGNGKQAVYYVHNLEHIPLTSMGEGVVNIVGLITDLCVAEDRIFLIEEPENDIHPKALKSLLDLIAKKSDSNQFFISTHSNIVMKHLGAYSGTKIFKVSNTERAENKPNLFLSKLEEVGENPDDRRKVLEELGYDFFDYDLWKGWLFLEESSAEEIIRDYLIKWFVPDLKYKLRTFSAGSVTKIQSKFDDFNRLFVFLHLEPTYKNKVWVYIDSGPSETEIINKMKAAYTTSGWSVDNFNQFSEHDFERYYPSNFKQKVDSVLAITDKHEKIKKKQELLKEVKAWSKENETEAKAEFKESAKEIIGVLKKLNKELK